ncbi:bile acid:sodium symporter family protein [Amphritea opalescens]|uniref:Bile acid:sodium symporter family protein n=1 Tax=Amphritea opalescens TaxID=2490544 RepID=A0A430KW87_9GAMM|nr:bile acid:sodium symporter family protein [Amphritea opalescens]RTE67634.1 bile acid:sodium symporter family protein [Amphritea opalescens]
MEGGNALSLLLPIALFVIMLGMGLTLTLGDFIRLRSRPVAIIAGLLLQLVLLPLLAWLVVMLMDLPVLLAAGLLIVSFAPGGATSNMISYLCRADTALSISLTAITSLIIPFSLPWLTWLTLEYLLGEGVLVALPVLTTIMKLVVVTLVPVTLGVVINHRWPLLCAQLQRPIKVLSLVFMVIVVVMISWANRQVLPQLLPVLSPAIILLASSAMILAGVLARYLLGLSTATALTLSIETGIQNAGTALMVTGALLQQPEMSLAVLLYGILMQIPALLLVVWRNWPLRRPSVLVDTQ